MAFFIYFYPISNKHCVQSLYWVTFFYVKMTASKKLVLQHTSTHMPCNKAKH